MTTLIVTIAILTYLFLNLVGQAMALKKAESDKSARYLIFSMIYTGLCAWGTIYLATNYRD